MKQTEQTEQTEQTKTVNPNLFTGAYFPMRIYDTGEILSAQKLYSEAVEYFLSMEEWSDEKRSELLTEYADYASKNFLFGALAQAMEDVIRSKQ